MLKASGRLRNVFVRGPQMPGPHNCYFFLLLPMSETSDRMAACQRAECHAQHQMQAVSMLQNHLHT